MSCFSLNFFFSLSLHPSQHLNQTSTFLKSNILIHTKRNCYLFLISLLNAPSPPPVRPSPHPSLLLLSQQGTLSPPLKVKLTIFSANKVLVVSSAALLTSVTLGSRTLLSSWSNVILQLTNQHCWSTVSWLLWSSPTDIKLHTTDHPAIVNSFSQGFRPQAIWHQKVQTLRFTSFHFYPKLSDMPAYSISFTEQPVGSQPHCPSMKCNCASGTVKISTWEVSANKMDYHFI